MTNLTDLQSLLLATAASRDNGRLLPLPTTIKTPAAGVARSVASLLSKALAEEREVTDVTPVHRSDGDLRFGLFVTAAGKAAIGVVEDDGEQGGTPEPASVATPKRNSKITVVLDLLRRADGATVPELIAVTGWLPHTTGAALTGLRKKGHTLDKSKRDGGTCYRVVAA